VSGTLRIAGGKALRGQVRVPIDLEVAQASLLMAALADGCSELPSLPPDSDATRFLELLAGMGVRYQSGERLLLDGVGLHGLRMPQGALDCGTSFYALALCAGLLSGQRFGTRILARTARSASELVGPLRARGAHIAATSDAQGRALPPLAVAPLVEGEALRALDCSFSVANPAAKSGVLVSALFAAGPTTLAEPSVSADHMERLFVGLGLPLRRIGSVVAFDPGAWDRVVPPQRHSQLPGSASIAAYLAVAAQLVPGSAITLDDAGINPSRAGVLDVMRSWGADLAVAPSGDASLREPIGQLHLRTRGIRGGVLGGEELVRSHDEVAALAMLAAASQRGIELFDLSAVDAAAWTPLPELLQAFGLECELAEDRLRVAPRQALRAARFDARDDAQLALAATTLALASPGESVLEHASHALARSYPGFLEAVRALGAEIQAA
jgi:3-phosphoshikimate 1-carboxyvinyltransferase